MPVVINSYGDLDYTLEVPYVVYPEGENPIDYIRLTDTQHKRDFTANDVLIEIKYILFKIEECLGFKFQLLDTEAISKKYYNSNPEKYSENLELIREKEEDYLFSYRIIPYIKNMSKEDFLKHINSQLGLSTIQLGVQINNQEKTLFNLCDLFVYENGQIIDINSKDYINSLKIYTKDFSKSFTINLWDETQNKKIYTTVCNFNFNISYSLTNSGYDIEALDLKNTSDENGLRLGWGSNDNYSLSDDSCVVPLGYVTVGSDDYWFPGEFILYDDEYYQNYMPGCITSSLYSPAPFPWVNTYDLDTIRYTKSMFDNSGLINRYEDIDNSNYGKYSPICIDTYWHDEMEEQKNINYTEPKLYAGAYNGAYHDPMFACFNKDDSYYSFSTNYQIKTDSPIYLCYFGSRIYCTKLLIEIQCQSNEIELY